MLNLKLPSFFLFCVGEGTRAAILKLAHFSQKRVRSYIVLALADNFEIINGIFCKIKSQIKGVLDYAIIIDFKISS